MTRESRAHVPGRGRSVVHSLVKSPGLTPSKTTLDDGAGIGALVDAVKIELERRHREGAGRAPAHPGSTRARRISGNGMPEMVQDAARDVELRGTWSVLAVAAPPAPRATSSSTSFPALDPASAAGEDMLDLAAGLRQRPAWAGVRLGPSWTGRRWSSRRVPQLLWVGTQEESCGAPYIHV